MGALFLFPHAAASHIEYAGGGAGQMQHSAGAVSRCTGALSVDLLLGQGGRWNITLAWATGEGTDWNLVCPWPRIWKFDEVRGGPGTGWYADWVQGCERQALRIGPAGLSTNVSYTEVDACGAATVTSVWSGVFPLQRVPG